MGLVKPQYVTNVSRAATQRDVGYGRISTDQLRQGLGVTRQHEDIRSTSERTGGTLVAFHSDNDVSASRYTRKARHGYDQVLALVRADAVDRIIVYDLDRLLRRPAELEELIDLVEARPGFTVVNVAGEIDLTTSDGRFIARILVAKAAKESDDISRRTRRQIEQVASTGRPRTSKRAFGYSCIRDPACQLPGCLHDGVSVLPGEAELLRQAARDVLAGESLTGIARRWNAAGVLTPQTGRPWSTPVVRQVLLGPRAAGLRAHRGAVVAVGTWEPILDRDTHDALVRLLTDPDRRRKNPPRRQPFTGILFDSSGRPMTTATATHRNGRKQRTYRTDPGRHPGPGRVEAKVTISAEPLEELVEELLFLHVESGAVAERAQARRRRQPQPVAGDDLASLESDLRALAEDHGAGRISRLEWLAARRPLQARLERARAAREAAAAVDVADDLPPDVRARWASYSPDRKRAILAAVFDRVVVHPATRRGPLFDERRVEPIWRE